MLSKIKVQFYEFWYELSKSTNTKNDGKILTYLGIRIALLFAVTIVTVLTFDNQKFQTNFIVYSLTFGSFILTYFFSLWFEELKTVQYFVVSQILYDLLYSGALILYTGGVNSIYLPLIPLTIIYAAFLLGKRAAIATGVIAVGVALTINTLGPKSSNSDEEFMIYVYSIAYMVIAVLAGSLIQDAQKSKEELHKKEKVLESLERFNGLILENMNAGMIAYDPKGEVKAINRVIKEWIGKGERESKKWIQNNWNRISKINSKQKTIQQIHFPDSTRNLQISNTVIMDEKQKPLEIFFLYDMTDFRKLEERNARMEKLASVGRLAAGIAHEIRNPLAGISGSAEVLADHYESVTDDDHLNLLKNIVKETERLNRLIEDFLGYAKPNKSNNQDIDLKTLIEEIITLTQSSLKKEKRVKIHSKLDGDVLIFGNPDRVKQSLLNLVKNSIEACGSKKQGEISIRLSKNSSHAIININDNGDGIPEENQEKIFEPFFTSKNDGTGLGLATTFSNIKEHSGIIELIQSSPELGTLFEVRFPLTQSSDEETGVA